MLKLKKYQLSIVWNIQEAIYKKKRTHQTNSLKFPGVLHDVDLLSSSVGDDSSDHNALLPFVKKGWLIQYLKRFLVIVYSWILCIFCTDNKKSWLQKQVQLVICT